MQIVPFNLTFLPDLYRICLSTGDEGRSAEHLYRDQDLLGHYYAAPYGVLEPESCFMLMDRFGACGYIVGTCNSEAYATRVNAGWLGLLRARLPAPAPTDDSRDAQMIRRIHAGYAAPRIAERFPAHLHINLLPRAQGQGAGRRLMEHFLTHLRLHRVHGVHLGVGTANSRAMAFYEHLGFSCIEEPAWGRRYALGLTSDLSSC